MAPGRAAFAALLLLVGCAQVQAPLPPAGAPLAPTIVLVSLDGFRADYLERYGAPALKRIAEEGVRADYLLSIFPTKTFPNHYTLVTGLYPDRHGIVSNTVYDEGLGRGFRISDRSAVGDGTWWEGEPIWVTLQKQGMLAAPFFWPGSEAEIGGVRPQYFRSFDNDIPADTRIEWVIDALKRPPDERPVFLTFYLSDVDGAGHRHGPDSEQVMRTVARVDSLVARLYARLREEGFAEYVNLIVTSDHGMAATSADRVVFLDDYIDLDEVYVRDLDPVAMLQPVSREPDEILGQLGSVPNVTFYRRNNLPEHLHYGTHRRIPELIGLADDGWRITTRSSFERNPSRFDGGTHGYDPSLPSMHGIFLARGPDFAQGIRVPAFSNVHVYALMTHLLGADPAPNDGALDSVRHMLQEAPIRHLPQ